MFVHSSKAGVNRRPLDVQQPDPACHVGSLVKRTTVGNVGAELLFVALAAETTLLIWFT